MDKSEDLIVCPMLYTDFLEIKDSLKEKYDEFWNENILKSEIENPNSKYYILKEKNIIIGFGGYIITPQDIEITNIVIKKDNRNSGYGNFLFERILEYAEKDLAQIKDEPKIISLEVNETNIPAINLYEKNGFKKIGIRKKYYDNMHDAIIMTKNVT